MIHDREKILFVSKLLTTLLAVVSLSIPIVVLYNIATITTRLWALALFTTLFSLALCCLTESRHYEMFTAIAAYCAVMVVFVGNLPGT